METHEWVFDPADEDTYPSVCACPEDIRDRFGLVGGETLRQTRRELRAYRDGRMLWRWIDYTQQEVTCPTSETSPTQVLS